MDRPRPQPALSAAPDLRIVEIDVLRGIALIGIYWINVVIFALPHGAYSLPHLLGDALEANIATWLFSEIFIEGTMRALFSMLFGASTLIFLDEARLSTQNGIAVVDRYYRRCMTLMLFGLIHAFFLLAQWDLLYAYGLLGMFLFPLRNLKPRILLLVAVAFFAVSDYNTWVENYDALKDNEDIRTATSEQAAAYREQARESNIEEFQTDLDTYRGGYLGIFRDQIPVIVEQQSTKMYTDHVFDVGGMMLLGMAFMKLGILTGQRSWMFYAVFALFGYLVGGSLRGLEAYELWLADFNAEARDPFLMMPYNLDRLILTIGHIGAFGLMVKSGIVARIAPWVAPVGRMALSNYVGQTLISIFLFYGFALALFGEFERYQLIYVFIAVTLLQIFASRAWLKVFTMGPLEWLWRSMIYGKWQPLRRGTGREPALS